MLRLLGFGKTEEEIKKEQQLESAKKKQEEFENKPVKKDPNKAVKMILNEALKPIIEARVNLDKAQREHQALVNEVTNRFAPVLVPKKSGPAAVDSKATVEAETKVDPKVAKKMQAQFKRTHEAFEQKQLAAQKVRAEKQAERIARSNLFNARKEAAAEAAAIPEAPRLG